MPNGCLLPIGGVLKEDLADDLENEVVIGRCPGALGSRHLKLKYSRQLYTGS